MPSFSDKVEFENTVVVCKSKSGLALLVRFEDQEEPQWMPQSQIDDDSEVFDEGQSGLLIVSRWIAEEKGLV